MIVKCLHSPKHSKMGAGLKPMHKKSSKDVRLARLKILMDFTFAFHLCTLIRSQFEGHGLYEYLQFFGVEHQRA